MSISSLISELISSGTQLLLIFSTIFSYPGVTGAKHYKHMRPYKTEVYFCFVNPQFLQICNPSFLSYSDALL